MGVSYKESDSNVIPINYIPSKPIPSKTVSKTVQPIQKIEKFVEMRWVQCGKCLKWRRIPTSISDKELEGEWSCSMNKWDLKRNSCSAEEEAYDLTEEQTVEVTNGSNSPQNEKKKRILSKFSNVLSKKRNDIK